jgi:hypothetical protein
MNTELDILKRNRNEINKNCCLLEFEVKGFKDRLDGLRVPYKVYFRNPLHKNRFVVGIPRFEFDEIVSNEGLVVIGMVDTKKCNDYKYYVFDGRKNAGFLSGIDGFTQYVNVCIRFKGDDGVVKTFYLPVMEDF